MPASVYGAPLLALEGETKTLGTTAGYIAVKPGWREVKMYCSQQWRLAISPKLASVNYYNASTYTDYTSQATDRDAATHVPLDAMGTTHKLYLGVSAPVKGFYFNLDGTNLNANAASLDWEYLYDVSKPGHFTLTGTVSAAMTVGETLTGSVSGATGVHVYDNGSTYAVVKSVSGTFAVGEDADGASQSCNILTAIANTAPGTGYFTDVAGDSDGTLTGTETLSQDGLYAFTLPAVVKGGLAGINNTPLYWYRFAPSATLSAAMDVIDLIPDYKNTSYGYMEPGMEYQFALDETKCGGFVVASTAGTPTLDVSWVSH